MVSAHSEKIRRRRNNKVVSYQARQNHNKQSPSDGSFPRKLSDVGLKYNFCWKIKWELILIGRMNGDGHIHWNENSSRCWFQIRCRKFIKFFDGFAKLHIRCAWMHSAQFSSVSWSEPTPKVSDRRLQVNYGVLTHFHYLPITRTGKYTWYNWHE